MCVRCRTQRIRLQFLLLFLTIKISVDTVRQKAGLLHLQQSLRCRKQENGMILRSAVA